MASQQKAGIMSSATPPTTTQSINPKHINGVGPLHVAYSDQYLGWRLGSGDGNHPTNPIRAQLVTTMLVEELGEAVTIVDPAAVDLVEVRRAVESIHDPRYVSEVIDDGASDEWSGHRPEMGRTALTMFAGTHTLVAGVLAGSFKVGFNPQGAKHHAAFATSAGFCVFNDMAWAATAFSNAGLRPLYIDWDIHAGDGVQHLLENTTIPTLSVHNHSLYPGDAETINRERARENQRHTAHDVDRAIYNWGVNPGDGDEALLWAIQEMRAVIDEYQPGVILLATGADGHSGEGNLGNINNYSYAGFEQAALMVSSAANAHANGRVLIGGAGGYQPLDHTPRIWANVVETIYAHVTP
jgi:acetoin utilization protein AcuC